MIRVKIYDCLGGSSMRKNIKLIPKLSDSFSKI